MFRGFVDRRERGGAVSVVVALDFETAGPGERRGIGDRFRAERCLDAGLCGRELTAARLRAHGEVGASIPIAIAGFVGSSLIAGAHRRAEFLRAGLAAGLAGWLCSLGYSLLVSGAVSQEMGYEGLTAIFGGLITAMVIPGGDTRDRVGA